MDSPKFAPSLLPEDNPLYSRKLPLIGLIEYLPLGLEEILKREGANISEILEKQKQGIDTTALEEDLRKRVFDEISEAENYAYSRELSRKLRELRIAGRDFLRCLAHNSAAAYADAWGIGKERVAFQRYVVLLGLGRREGYLEELSRALIPVELFGEVESLESFLLNRQLRTGSALHMSDMIYSHHTEEFDDEGYVLDPEKGERQLLTQIGEGIMFTLEIAPKDKNKKIDALVQKLGEELLGYNQNTRNKQRGRLRQDLERLFYVGVYYPHLYDALFQIVAYTLKVGDFLEIDRRRMDVTLSSEELNRLLQSKEGVDRLIKTLESLVADQSLIHPPIGFTMGGWKGPSFAQKLLIATYFGVIHDNEDELRAYLISRGIDPKEGPYTRRDLRDFLRAKYLTWGRHTVPFSNDLNMPDRDIEGEKQIWVIFGNHHGLTQEEVQSLIQDPNSVQPRFSPYGIFCDFGGENDFENRLGQNAKGNGYSSLNTACKITTSQGILPVEIAYQSNLADARAHFENKQSHKNYAMERAAIVDWLIYKKGVISPEEWYALRMLVTPGHKVI